MTYMREISHAAIDAGADLVIGHGPHYSLPVEVYKGRAIFYGLGSFSFHTGHGGRRHGDWIGMMPTASVERNRVTRVRFRFVRHNDHNQTVPCVLADEAAELADISERSKQWGTRFTPHDDEVQIEGL
jgi:poly-gamma-glutamate capsule biosynthesis protein CapA/YwtB (metallophosphatase superfamily)